MRQILLAATALIALSACSQSGTNETQRQTPEPEVTQPVSTEAESQRLNAWFDKTYEEELMMSPMTLTQLGRKDRHAYIDDMSWEATERKLEWRRATVEELKSGFDYDSLDASAKMSYNLWLSILEEAEQAWKWRFHSYNFEQMGGAQARLPQFLITYHRVDNEADMLAYISRVRETGRALQQLLQKSRESAERGIRPPAFAYRGAQAQAEAVIAGSPFVPGEDSSVWADMKSEIAALVDKGAVTEARAAVLLAEAQAALLESFGPAYEALISWLKEDVSNTGDSFGVSALPDGEAFYAYRLARSTTTTLTPDEVHEIGLLEVARLRAEMEKVKDEFGFEGSLQEFFAFLRDTRDDERLYFPDTDEGRQGYIDEATRYINNLKQHLPVYFGLLPKADIVVKRVEPFRERPGAAQHYNAGTPDGTRPGVYYAHLSDMTAMPKRELEVIAYHEAVPGHHMQISIAQELSGIPQFRTRQFYNAYVEGWALYSEYLAKEMPGTYESPLSEFGRLDSEIWRAIRLVVDTGLHVKGWTKEEAISYFQENSAITEQQAVAEVERYLTWPGQAAGYKIGMIRILELRERARTELGERFDIRGFHDAVLGGGGLPLDLLEKRVDQWIASVKSED